MTPPLMILWALERLAKPATPPDVRRVLRRPEQTYYDGDPVALALETMRREGTVDVTWTETGCAMYGLK